MDIEIQANGTVLMISSAQHCYLEQTDVKREPTTWQQYICEITEWERTLLHHNWETNTSSLSAVLQDENAKVMAVSDGGQIGDIGTFGWVIGTESEILWEGQGAACGQPMTSHRAEAYGKLAWLCFLKHYIIFLNLQVR